MEYIFGTLTENTQSLLTIPVPFGEEYKPYFMDLFRMVAIQTMVNFMFYLSDPVKNSLLSGTYIKTLFFVLLGVSVYWLVFRNLITFKYEGGSSLLVDTQVAEEVAEVAETAAL
tara:strand:+ start:795 stop:1136 length:342 start_codon:yes stop_codon:yes gene_type:complete